MRRNPAGQVKRPRHRVQHHEAQLGSSKCPLATRQPAPLPERWLRGPPEPRFRCVAEPACHSRTAPRVEQLAWRCLLSYGRFWPNNTYWQSDASGWSAWDHTHRETRLCGGQGWQSCKHHLLSMHPVACQDRLKCRRWRARLPNLAAMDLHQPSILEQPRRRVARPLDEKDEWRHDRQPSKRGPHRNTHLSHLRPGWLVMAASIVSLSCAQGNHHASEGRRATAKEEGATNQWEAAIAVQLGVSRKTLREAGPLGPAPRLSLWVASWHSEQRSSSG